MQGAGGVGGLIEVNSNTNGSHFAAADGNGNVAALFSVTNGTVTASYEYGPFGETIRESGPMAKLNVLRWSSKYADDETDLVYYGYRYYNPSMGRWLNRDPIEEEGGHDLYAFVGNDPGNYVDSLGLEEITKDLPRPLPSDAVKCCTEDKISKGEQELKDRYRKAEAEASRLRLVPAPLGFKGATCRNSSTDIIGWLSPRT
jgi:RHS repeat-associated protein